MILTTGGLQGFRNAYGNLLRKVRIRWWGTAGESHGGALFSSMWTSTSPAEHAAYNGFFLKQRRETKRTIFSANFFFLYCLKRIIIKMSIVRSSNSSVSSGVTSKENLRITFLNFFFFKQIWGFNVHHMGKDCSHLPQLQPTQVRYSPGEDNTSSVTCFLLSFSLDSAERTVIVPQSRAQQEACGHGEAGTTVNVALQ